MGATGLIVASALQYCYLAERLQATSRGVEKGGGNAGFMAVSLRIYGVASTVEWCNGELRFWCHTSHQHCTDCTL